MKRVPPTFALALALLLVLVLLVRPSMAQEPNTVAYSAANCVPGSNGGWGNTDGDPDGFYFQQKSGIFSNTEPQGEYLYCPVSYKYTSLAPVTIIVTVYDASRDR